MIERDAPPQLTRNAPQRQSPPEQRHPPDAPRLRTARSSWSALPARCAARSSPASSRADLERSDQGYGLTLERTKGPQTEAVLVPLPYGKTELCPVRALARWLDAAAITDGPVFRRLWLPAQAAPDAPLPARRIGKAPLTPRSIARIV